MKKFLFFSVLFFLGFIAKSQKTNLTESEINEYKDQVKLMVDYLEETMNFIGNPDNSTQDKDIIFRDSYIKIFRDENIQIEDDLDNNRRTALSKDVQAYLKDIDFFFKKAVFDFNIQSIDPLTNENGETYFKVSMMRELSAKTISGDSIHNSQERFLEINVDPYKKELKIVSFYTTKLNQKEDLRTWWNEMSLPWKSYFSYNKIVFDSLEMNKICSLLDDAFVMLSPHEVFIQDSLMIVGSDTLEMSRKAELFGHKPDTVIFVSDTVVRWTYDTIQTDLTPFYDELLKCVNLKEINISGNLYITTLNPLSQLSDLAYLDCSNTAVSDVYPIRNLNKIKELNIANTDISDIFSLKYASALEKINADNTSVQDIKVVELFNNLYELSVSNTDVYDLTPISECSNLGSIWASKTKITDLNALKNLNMLYSIDVSRNNISDLGPLKNLNNLQILDIDSTKVLTLDSLSRLEKLNELKCSNTKISSLDALNNLPHLNKVYCDNTLIDEKIASDFVRNNPHVLVIYETQVLQQWWDYLPIYWKSTFAQQNNTSANPSSEELHTIINMKNLEVNSALQNANPISRLTNLERLDLSKAKIDDIRPLFGLHHLKYLNLENSKVSDLSPLKDLVNLQEINISNTNVSNLEALNELTNLRIVWADGSKVTPEQVYNLRLKQPLVKVVYQTKNLQQWWGILSDGWRDVFKSYVNCDVNPSDKQLQDIVDLEDIVIDPSFIIQSIEPLSKLVFLKTLTVNNNQIQDLSPIGNNLLIKELNISGNPVSDLSPLAADISLEVINIENTPVSNIEPLSSLSHLRVLNIGGTSVKNLKALSNNKSLEDISLVNTGIKSLSPVENIPTLKYIKAYNTKIKQKNIDVLRLKRNDLNISYY